MENYSSMKLELLAVKWAVTEKFREYLLGNTFTIYTDNNPLSHLQTAKLGALEQRWASQLASFNFTIRYRPGRKNGNADALSRQYLDRFVPGTELPSMLGQSILEQQATGVGAYCNEVGAFPRRTPTELATLQGLDPVVGPILKFWQMARQPSAQERQELTAESRELLRHWGTFCEREGVLYRQSHQSGGGREIFQLILPKCLQEEVLRSIHEGHGHQGVDRTLQLMRERCFWPGMTKGVEQWCQNCERCTLGKALQPKVKTYQGTLLASRPHEILAMDFTTLDPSSDGREDVLILTDVFSKYTQAVPTRDQKAGTVAQVLVQHWL